MIFNNLVDATGLEPVMYQCIGLQPTVFAARLQASMLLFRPEQMAQQSGI